MASDSSKHQGLSLLKIMIELNPEQRLAVIFFNITAEIGTVFQDKTKKKKNSSQANAKGKCQKNPQAQETIKIILSNCYSILKRLM